jgi:O-succinylbenzoate synthase
VKLSYFAYRIPFVHPIRIGGALQSERKGLYVRAQDGQGRVGWGEVSPLDGYGPDTLAEVLESLSDSSIPVPPSLRFGLDCAHREIQAQEKGISFRSTIGAVVRQKVESAQLVSTRQPDSIRFLKSKVGSSTVDEDVSRIADILEGLPSDGRLRLDANGIWTKEEAFRFAGQLQSEHGALVGKIEFIEEPWQGCFATDQAEAGQTAYPFPLAIDESFSLADPTWRLAEVIMVKPSLFGSIDEFLSARRLLVSEGKRVVLSSAFETGLGMSALVALASTVPGEAEGFGTYRYLATEQGPATAPETTRTDFSWLLESTILVDHIPDLPGEAFQPALSSDPIR